MRRDLITRTVTATKVTVKVINPATDEITTKDVVLGKAIEDSDKIAKLVKKQLKDSTDVFVGVVATEKLEKLYGITVEDFIAHSIELDPTTREEIQK